MVLVDSEHNSNKHYNNSDKGVYRICQNQVLNVGVSVVNK